MGQTLIRSEQTDIATDTMTLTNKTLTNPTVNFTDKAVTQNVLVWAYRNEDQDNLTDSTATTVQLNGEIYDVGGDFDTSTYTFTAPVAGYYLILAQVTYNDNVDAKRYDCLIRKNGSAYIDSYAHSSGTGVLSVSARGIANLAVNDTIILQARQYAGVNTVDITGAGGATFLQIMLLSL